MNKHLLLISSSVILVAVLVFASWYFGAYAPTITQSKIIVTNPAPYAVVSSPLTISGAAVGNWFFEASFPVELLDGNGTVIASGPAHTDADWMTTEMIPFTATLTFTKPATQTGTLVLKKDNPSGLPQHDESISIPIRFSSEFAVQKKCVIGGCSGQVCGEEGKIGATTCEALPEYACYKKAECTQQSNGECGFTPTAALTLCIQKARIGDFPKQ